MKGFQEAGFKPEVRPLAFFQDDYGLKAEEGEDDVEEEEGEEGEAEEEDEDEDERSEGSGDDHEESDA